MNRKTVQWIALAAVALLLVVLPLLSLTTYVVDPREMAVVLQFGNPVHDRREPGLYFKQPFIQTVRKLPRTRQFWGGQAEHALPDLPTKDGKKIDVVPWAIWRISNPTEFVRRMRRMDVAEQRVAEFVRGAVRDVITQYDLNELVRSSDRELTYSFRVSSDSGSATQLEETGAQMAEAAGRIAHGREKILAQIEAEAQKRLGAGEADAAGVAGEGGRGVELIDVGIAQIEFVPAVREVAFDRLIAFMESIASYYSSEGERMKQEILNRASADVQRIEGEGTRRANELRGQADAEVIRSYADAITQAGEFYTFLRSLEAYKAAFGANTRLVLTTDSEFLRLLKDAGAAAPPEAPPSAAAP